MRNRRAGARDTREAIRTAAIELFSSKGFAATSTREICDRAKVTKPVLYYHFHSKDVLYQRLLADASKAIAELGFLGTQGEHMVVLENTPKVHNMVVCTLCSCYPWPVLGLPPVWYKSAPYRSRAVIDPRGVLKEFGLDLPADVEVRVWDSTAELRYLVLPERPAGTEALSEEALAALVTRDSMIGVARVQRPGTGGGK